MVAAQTDGAVTLNYGKFLNVCIDFIFVALAVYLCFKLLRYVGKSAKQKGAQAMEEPESQLEAQQAVAQGGKGGSGTGTGAGAARS